MKILCINCEPDLSYFTKRGLKLELEHKKTTDVYPLQYINKVKDSDGQMKDIYTPWPVDFIKNIQGYNIIMVGWKPEQYDLKTKSTGGYSYWGPNENKTYWCTVRQDTPPNNNYAIHELHHVLCSMVFHTLKKHVLDNMDVTPVNGVMMSYYKNDQPEAPDSNYAVTWNNLKPLLSELNEITVPKTQITPMYKYFKPNEIVGLKSELVVLLDKARGIAGIPFKITSGLRTTDENKKAGGVPDSAHLTGLAVDIACTTDTNRWKIIDACRQVGFNRLGIAKTFIHCDIDNSKSPNVIWLYE